jgi:hypothetical protein
MEFPFFLHSEGHNVPLFSSILSQMFETAAPAGRVTAVSG